ncbi:MAG: tRNA-dihydrouridine synthase [Deltaproteobacteria bacterium]|nr:tRNA-dihydrouridine synthase [Deltaproteobacteria bacterium]
MSSFSWQQLPQPIFGLAPMDGVTDSTFRTILYRYGAPDVLFTEFVSVEGLVRQIPAMFQDLQYEENERPMIAQIYGYEPEAFRKSVQIVAKLGFDGIDINMGCPAKSVVHSGGGAALIKTCPHAQQIIYTCSQALDEYFDQTGKRIPLSVKTRLGYTQNSVKDWIRSLLDTEKLSNISLHGRTLKQGYGGNADWDAIAEAAEITQHTKTLLLGNGDLQSLGEALQKIKQSKVNGVLLGRASYGNPWLFRHKEAYRSFFRENEMKTFECPRLDPEISIEERSAVLLEHAKLLAKRKAASHFIQIRKHAAWYMKGFEGASELRKQLVEVRSVYEIERVLNESHFSLHLSQKN